MESLQMDLGSLKVATSNFLDANKLGEGGFGPVYKVCIISKKFTILDVSRILDFGNNHLMYISRENCLMDDKYLWRDLRVTPGKD